MNTLTKNKPRVCAIVQARLTSNRLPRKVLMDLGGKTVLERVIERIEWSKSVDDIIIAIPDNTKNLELEVFIEKKIPHAIRFSYKGDENDVLSRTIQAQKRYGAEITVDITSDCPCVMPNMIRNLVDIVMNDPEYYYASNVITRSYPDGLDVQVYSSRVLEKLGKSIPKTSPHREHSGWNIPFYSDSDGKGLGLYNMYSKEPFYPEGRITLDTAEDYEVIKSLYENYGTGFSVTDILNHLTKDKGKV